MVGELNVGITAFVSIRTNPEWLERFAEAVREMPEVWKLYRRW